MYSGYGMFNNAERYAKVASSAVPMLPEDPRLAEGAGRGHDGRGRDVRTRDPPENVRSHPRAHAHPDTFIGHPFWKAEKPEDRRPQLIHFLKNAGLFGGLLYVSADKRTQARNPRTELQRSRCVERREVGPQPLLPLGQWRLAELAPRAVVEHRVRRAQRRYRVFGGCDRAPLRPRRPRALMIATAKVVPGGAHRCWSGDRSLEVRPRGAAASRGQGAPSRSAHRAGPQRREAAGVRRPDAAWSARNWDPGGRRASWFAR